jgi:hypothetical protein
MKINEIELQADLYDIAVWAAALEKQKEQPTGSG